MTAVLQHVAKKESFRLPDSTCEQIFADSGGNVRKAILVLEALRMQSPDLSGSLSIAKPDWETYAIATADAILSEQSPQRLLDVRGKLYELLVHAIPPRLVIKTITDRLVRRVDENLRPLIVDKAAFYVSGDAMGQFATAVLLRRLGCTCDIAGDSRQARHKGDVSPLQVHHDVQTTS